MPGQSGKTFTVNFGMWEGMHRIEALYREYTRIGLCVHQLGLWKTWHDTAPAANAAHTGAAAGE